MPSNVSRGALAKSRTKKWLISKGYQVADLEVVRWIFADGKRIPVKRDQFGSDLLAVNNRRVIFVQVKSGETARGGTFPDARREFGRYVFPPSVNVLIVAWPPRSRQPRLIAVKAGGHYEDLTANTETVNAN